MNNNSSLSAYFSQLQTHLEANSRTIRQQMDHQEYTIKELIQIVISLLEQQKTTFCTLKSAIVQLCQPLQQYYPSLNVSEQARLVLDGQENIWAALEDRTRHKVQRVERAQNVQRVQTINGSKKGLERKNAESKSNEPSRQCFKMEETQFEQGNNPLASYSYDLPPITSRSRIKSNPNSNQKASLRLHRSNLNQEYAQIR